MTNRCQSDSTRSSISPDHGTRDAVNNLNLLGANPIMTDLLNHRTVVPRGLSTSSEMVNEQCTSSSASSNALLQTNHNNDETGSLLQKRTSTQHIGNNLTTIRRESCDDLLYASMRYSNFTHRRKRYRQNEAIESDPWNNRQHNANLNAEQYNLRETYFRNRFMIVDSLNLPQFLICSILYQCNHNQLCLEYFNNNCLSRGMSTRYFKLLKFEQWFHSKKSYMDCGKNIRKRYKDNPNGMKNVVDHIGSYKYFPQNDVGITVDSDVHVIQQVVKNQINHAIVRWIIKDRQEYIAKQISNVNDSSKLYQ